MTSLLFELLHNGLILASGFIIGYVIVPLIEDWLKSR